MTGVCSCKPFWMMWGTRWREMMPTKWRVCEPSPGALWSIAYAVSLDNSGKQALTRWRIQLRDTHSIIWVFPQLLTSMWFYSSCDFILISLSLQPNLSHLSSLGSRTEKHCVMAPCRGPVREAQIFWPWHSSNTWKGNWVSCETQDSLFIPRLLLFHVLYTALSYSDAIFLFGSLHSSPVPTKNVVKSHFVLDWPDINPKFYFWNFCLLDQSMKKDA